MSGIDARFAGNVFQKNYPAIIATDRHLAVILPARLTYDQDGYPAGQVLARNSVSGQFSKYDSGGSSGLDTAVAVLFDEVAPEDFASNTDTLMGAAIFKGLVYKSQLTDLDSDAITDLKGRTIIDATGVEILEF